MFTSSFYSIDWFWFCRFRTEIRSGRTWLQSAFFWPRMKSFEEKRFSVCLLCLNRLPSILGSGLRKRSYLHIGPPCKLWWGENVWWWLWFVCFHSCWSKGAYCGRLGAGSVEMSDNLSQWIESNQTCGPCISGQSSVKFTCCPQPHQPQTQLTLAVFVIFSQWNFLPTFFGGSHSPEREKMRSLSFFSTGERNEACGIFCLVCICLAVLQANGIKISVKQEAVTAWPPKSEGHIFILEMKTLKF